MINFNRHTFTDSCVNSSQSLCYSYVRTSKVLFIILQLARATCNHAPVNCTSLYYSYCSKNTFYSLHLAKQGTTQINNIVDYRHLLLCSNMDLLAIIIHTNGPS